VNESDEVDILLVEDNQDDLEMALRALSKANLADRIQIARDGVEAVDYMFCHGAYAKRNPACAPKLVLLDLKLPKMDGMEVLKLIKGDARTAMTPVVMLTSSKEQRDVIESYNLGVNSYIVKPVSLEAFVAAVRELGVYWLILNQTIRT